MLLLWRELQSEFILVEINYNEALTKKKEQLWINHLEVLKPYKYMGQSIQEWTK